MKKWPWILAIAAIGYYLYSTGELQQLMANVTPCPSGMKNSPTTPGLCVGQ